MEHASRGWSNKLIAYELGVAESTVSTHLSRAVAKLGLRSRAELIRLIAGAPDASASVQLSDVLSPAERAVVTLAFGGSSNRAIARARGVSTRTVENQMASAMRKLGATSRASLIATLARNCLRRS